MKDIFFLDMDATLLDFARAERVNFFRALGACGVSADEGTYARYHEINDGLWKLLEKGGITRAELTVRRFSLLFEEMGLADGAEDAAREYCEGFPEICYPFEGAAEFLKKLAARGRVYIVTNGGARIQRRHIELAGFAPYLSGVFISEEVGADKPSFMYVGYVEAHTAGFARERAVLLGDSLTSDMVCAERMGVDFVLFSPGGMSEGYTGKVARNYEEALSLMR